MRWVARKGRVYTLELTAESKDCFKSGPKKLHINLRVIRVETGAGLGGIDDKFGYIYGHTCHHLAMPQEARKRFQKPHRIWLEVVLLHGTEHGATSERGIPRRTCQEKGCAHWHDVWYAPDIRFSNPHHPSECHFKRYSTSLGQFGSGPKVL